MYESLRIIESNFRVAISVLCSKEVNKERLVVDSSSGEQVKSDSAYTALICLSLVSSELIFIFIYFDLVFGFHLFLFLLSKRYGQYSRKKR